MESDSPLGYHLTYEEMKLYNIDGKMYVPANPDKQLVSSSSVPDILVLPGDTVHLTYSQKVENGPEEIKYEQTWQCDAPARVTFKVKTYNDTSYELVHSVEYVKRVV